MHRAIATAMTAAFIALPGTSHALNTVIDFEGLQRGVQITNQLQEFGVLVSGIDTTGCCQPGKVLNHTLGDLGVFNFGGSGNQSLVYGIPGDQLNFDFVIPNTTTATVVQAVSLRVGDGDVASEKFRVTFKGLSGDVLDVQEFITGSGPVNGGVTVSFGGGGIHRVEILGLVYHSGGAVDDLTITAVPEPETYALMLAGLACVAAAAKRRKAD